MLSEALRFVAEPGRSIPVFSLCYPAVTLSHQSVLHGRAEPPAALQLPYPSDSDLCVTSLTKRHGCTGTYQQNTYGTWPETCFLTALMPLNLPRGGEGKRELIVARPCTMRRCILSKQGIARPSCRRATGDSPDWWLTSGRHVMWWWSLSCASWACYGC